MNPLKPMLSESGGMARLMELVDDGDYALEEKLDGHRTLVHKPAGEAAFVINREGDPSQHNDKFLSTPITSSLPSRRARELSRIPHDVILDGELIGDVLHIFDMPYCAGIGQVSPEDPWEHRRANLVRLLLDWEPDPTLFLLVESALDPEAKMELALRCLKEKAAGLDTEGLMAKLRSGAYKPGKRSTDSLKVKFEEEIDVEIDSLRFEGRDNAVLAVYDDNGAKVLVGRAKTSAKHDPKVGEVWTVRFLRFNEHDTNDPSGRLYQPRFICKRTDKAPTSCLYSQFTKTRKEVTA